jgi:hypothetical protein
MPLTCRNCSRINPPDAQYCYWDGAALRDHEQRSGPIAVGAQPFFSPFVFPSGRQCRNFDELVLACYGEWHEALDLLRQGYLESFFGSLGRADLALAAKQAMRAADLDRGLDHLLNKLPCGTREPPKLVVQPLEVNLGQITRDIDRRFVLHVENRGMGLLHGSIVCEETAWLALGEGPGSPRKVFQCLHEFALTVQVHAKALRAGNKPLEGRLTIESNGGPSTIVIRAEVPVRPFPEGALAGAVSPRQIAEKAKTNPKGSAPFFEKGAVAAWYESNGWTYPVQGPPSSGLGAIQQFFEALGLVKPPAVEINEQSVHLQGAPGASLEHVLVVRAQEARPVFAHATTGAPWLRIGRVHLDGRTARILLKVPNVPARPGERLEGKVQVTANGNQRFLVDVSLTITGRMAVRVDQLPPGAELDMNQVLAAPVLSAADLAGEEGIIPHVLPVAEVVATPVRRGKDEVVAISPASTSGGGGRQRGKNRGGDFDRKVSRIRKGVAKHLLPLGILLLLLLSVVAHDLIVILLQPPVQAFTDDGFIDPEPYLAIRFHDGPKEQNKEDEKMREPTMRFGLVMLREKDPEHPDRLKKLTFDEWGRTNNTCLRVDGEEFLFGHPPGTWIEMKAKLEGETAGRPRDGLASTWDLADARIRVTQEVEIVPGEQSRRLDTCLVRYTIENRDERPHRVGLRFLLDTFIGANDGVPFTIPGASGLCDTLKRFDRAADVPDFIQALERDDPQNPGTVAYLQFRIGKQVESPRRVTLGGWPNSELKQFGFRGAKAQLTKWNVPFISMKELDRLAQGIDKRAPYDSAVTMYWDEQPLEPEKKRVVGFTYGLGNVDTRESAGHLLLTVGGRLVRDGEFTLTALVHDPQPDERLTLSLPTGFATIEGAEEQDVPPVPAGAARPDSPVTWRIRAGNDGKYELAVQSNKGVKQKLPLTIHTRGVFD